jgi:hypothetical protein
MGRGWYGDAVAALDGVTPFLTYGTLRGGKCWLELAMACEALGDPVSLARAQEVYRKLASLSSDDDIRTQCRNLLFGFKAMGVLKSGDVQDRAAQQLERALQEEFREVTRPLWESPRVAFPNKDERRRAFEKKLTPIETFAAARELLLQILLDDVGRDDKAAKLQLQAALLRISRERAGEGGRDNPLLLRGTWRLAAATEGQAVAFPPRAQRRSFEPSGDGSGGSGSGAAGGAAGGAGGAWAAGGVDVALPPFGVGATAAGSVDWPNPAWELRLQLVGATVRGLPVPYRPPPSSALVLTVDERLHVTMDDSGPVRVYQVWIRDE